MLKYQMLSVRIAIWPAFIGSSHQSTETMHGPCVLVMLACMYSWPTVYCVIDSFTSILFIQHITGMMTM